MMDRPGWLEKVTFTQETVYEKKWDNEKDIWCPAWGPEFESPNPYGRRRDENNSQNLSPGRHMHAGAGDTVTNSHKHTR